MNGQTAQVRTDRQPGRQPPAALLSDQLVLLARIETAAAELATAAGKLAINLGLQGFEAGTRGVAAGDGLIPSFTAASRTAAAPCARPSGCASSGRVAAGIRRFLTADCILAPDVQCTFAALYDAYRARCHANHEPAASDKVFSRALRDLGCVVAASMHDHVRIYRGIRLLACMDPDDVAARRQASLLGTLQAAGKATAAATGRREAELATVALDDATRYADGDASGDSGEGAGAAPTATAAANELRPAPAARTARAEEPSGHQVHHDDANQSHQVPAAPVAPSSSASPLTAALADLVRTLNDAIRTRRPGGPR